MARTVLVIGATGALAPAASTLAADGVRVIGVSRRGSGGTIAVDARDADALMTALGGERWDDALVYSPAVTDESVTRLKAATPGRCVILRTSGAADPGLGGLSLPRDTVQLGWHAEPSPRWHTPDEISAAALATLVDGEPRTLGVVTPWSDRP